MRTFPEEKYRSPRERTSAGKAAVMRRGITQKSIGWRAGLAASGLAAWAAAADGFG